jgi:hypothetical protein
MRLPPVRCQSFSDPFVQQPPSGAGVVGHLTTRSHRAEAVAAQGERRERVKRCRRWFQSQSANGEPRLPSDGVLAGDVADHRSLPGLEREPRDCLPGPVFLLLGDMAGPLLPRLPRRPASAEPARRESPRDDYELVRDLRRVGQPEPRSDRRRARPSRSDVELDVAYGQRHLRRENRGRLAATGPRQGSS